MLWSVRAVCSHCVWSEIGFWTAFMSSWCSNTWYYCSSSCVHHLQGILTKYYLVKGEIHMLISINHVRFLFISYRFPNYWCMWWILSVGSSSKNYKPVVLLLVRYRPTVSWDGTVSRVGTKEATTTTTQYAQFHSSVVSSSCPHTDDESFNDHLWT